MVITKVVGEFGQVPPGARHGRQAAGRGWRSLQLGLRQHRRAGSCRQKGVGQARTLLAQLPAQPGHAPELVRGLKHIEPPPLLCPHCGRFSVMVRGFGTCTVVLWEHNSRATGRFLDGT